MGGHDYSAAGFLRWERFDFAGFSSAAGVSARSPSATFCLDLDFVVDFDFGGSISMCGATHVGDRFSKKAAIPSAGSPDA